MVASFYIHSSTYIVVHSMIKCRELMTRWLFGPGTGFNASRTAEGQWVPTYCICTYYVYTQYLLME